MYQINFVRRRRKALSKLEQQDRKYLRWSFIGLGVVIGVFLITLGSRLSIGLLAANTTAENSRLSKCIESKQQIEAQYVVFMTKVKILTDLFGQRTEKQEGINYFSSLFDPKIIVSQLAYSAETNTLNFTLRAPTIFDLETVFTTLKSANVRQKYPTYSIRQLSRSDNGNYGLSITLPLPTRPLGEAAAIAPEDPAIVEAGDPNSEVAPTTTEEPLDQSVDYTESQ